jgi:hypothetical protein
MMGSNLRPGGSNARPAAGQIPPKLRLHASFLSCNCCNFVAFALQDTRGPAVSFAVIEAFLF